MEYGESILGHGKRLDAFLTGVLSDEELRFFTTARVSPIIWHSLTICSSSEQLKCAELVKDWPAAQAAILFGKPFNIVRLRI